MEEQKTARVIALLEPSLKDRVQKVSDATGVSVAEYVRRGLELAIKDAEIVVLQGVPQ